MSLRAYPAKQVRTYSHIHIIKNYPKLSLKNILLGFSPLPLSVMELGHRALTIRQVICWALPLGQPGLIVF